MNTPGGTSDGRNGGWGRTKKFRVRVRVRVARARMSMCRRRVTTATHGDFNVTVWRNARMPLQSAAILYVMLCAVADFSV